MTTFDKREQGFERKFQHDQELAFKAKARRNRLLGLWAAERLGLTGEAAEVYARDVMAAYLQKPGDWNVVDKVARDFAEQGVKLDATRVRIELDRFMAEAKTQLRVPR
ncbi:MAG TPA: DUF1476 domain-containing protein [Stellaceae bacterium]|nr:DUF1476 domain-containing protein [Stellaceae bacterium]